MKRFICLFLAAALALGCWQAACAAAVEINLAAGDKYVIPESRRGTYTVDDESVVRAEGYTLKGLRPGRTAVHVSGTVSTDYAVLVLFSAQEETGGSGAKVGAFNSQADEAIACDVSFASAPGVSAEKYVALGSGTMVGYAPSLDYNMSRRLTEIAAAKDIPHTAEVMGGRTGTNGDDIQVSGRGIKTALLSIPIRNMHTAVEVVDLADIENTARLMAEYIIERSAENA